MANDGCWRDAGEGNCDREDRGRPRAGRAGRLGPGRVRRLWDRADRLRPYGEPEIHRIDLSDALLDILAWGGDPRTFEWFDPPPADRVDAAITLLEQLGAVLAEAN